MPKNPLPSKPLECEDNLIHTRQVQAVQKYQIDAATSMHLARTFQALSDPTRVRIIGALSNTELCVCDLAEVLDMTQSAVSHQLKSLRDLNLVKPRRAGREIFYTLDDEHIRELYELGLKHIQHSQINTEEQPAQV